MGPHKIPRTADSRSARVRTTHQHQGCLDVSPGFGVLALALFLAGARLLRSLGDGFLAVRVEQLSRVILDFDFSHPHGGPPLISRSDVPINPRTAEVMQSSV